jgi:DNA-binding response OmpR family regulator
MAKILIIEDNDEIRENVATLLECEGHEVIQASNGEDGARLAVSELPDLILCDVVMPGIDGFSVIQQIRKNEQIALTPFIFLTAKAEPASKLLGLNLGANDYVNKPFTMIDLISAITLGLKQGQIVPELIQTNNEAQAEITINNAQETTSENPSRMVGND